MAKWEYKVENYDGSIDNETALEELLNEYGEHGFELVNITPQYSSSSNTEFIVEEISIMHHVLVFKRKIED